MLLHVVYLEKIKKVRKIGQKETFQEKKYIDKGIIPVPRQLSCTINRTLVNWGKVGHNVPQTCINITVSTIKG